MSLPTSQPSHSVQPDLSSIPQLTHLATLPAPHGRGLASRAWQSSAHPSPSAPLLAVAAADKNVYVWSLRSWRLVSTIQGGHKRSVRCVRWKGYGSGENDGGKEDGGNKVTLATGSFDANVGVWEHVSSRRRRAWGGKVESGGGDELMEDVGGDDVEDDDDDNAEEWNFTTLLTGPDSEIKDIAFSPSTYGANLLATSSRDKSVWVWEEVEDEEWETIAVLQEHAGDVKCVRWNEGVKVKDKETRETRVVGGREILASGSYDDTVRLWRDVEEEGDWACVSVLEGHGGTVWDVAWEGWVAPAVQAEKDWEVDWEPRLITCSDDLSVRVWRREMTEQEREKKRARLGHEAAGVGGCGGAAITQRMPSILKTTGYFETWVEQARLPGVHVRSVYAVDWSRRTGLVVTCGGDGSVVVYKEVQSPPSADQDTPMVEADGEGQENAQSAVTASTWKIVALIEAAHDEYEVNHVCWAPRRDDGKRFEGEEVIVSTGDDGDVKVWTLPDGLVQGPS
jgi:cytosolic iron-sulfur protein assembly protein CIAO1